MKTRQRALSVALACFMAVSYAGCSSSSSSSSAPASSSAAASSSSTVSSSAPASSEAAKADNEYGVPQISAEPITLRIYASKGSTTPDYNEMEHMKKYSEYTNVFVEWEQPPQDLSAERFNIVIASNDLPDMFWNIKADQYTQLKTAQAIIPVQDYFADCPNLQKIIADNPGMDKYFFDPDGRAFSLPFFDGLTVNDPLILRKDWLDKLGLEAPVTKDDWYKYWTGVRDNDMNGNGDPSDEIPLSGTSFKGILSLVSAFEMDNGFFVDPSDGNKVKYSYYDPRYKEYLTWIHQLWEDKIIDPNILAVDSKTLGNNTALNLVGSYRGKLNGQLNTYMTTMPDKIEGFDLLATEPMKSDNGVQFHPGSVPLVRTDTIGGVVTVTSKYPKESVQYCDWFYDFSDPYGGAFMNIFGYEGVTFQYNSDKTDYEYTDWVLHNPDGLSPQQALQTLTTRCQHPSYVPPIGSFKMWHPSTVASYENNEPFYEESLKYKIPSLTFSDADAKKIRSAMADIGTYVEEMSAKFMTGEVSLDEFDNYIQTIQGMGIEEVLDIYNATYTEWNQPRS